jgi:hypothetical protein
MLGMLVRWISLPPWTASKGRTMDVTVLGEQHLDRLLCFQFPHVSRTLPLPSQVGTTRDAIELLPEYSPNLRGCTSIEAQRKCPVRETQGFTGPVLGGICCDWESNGDWKINHLFAPENFLQTWQNSFEKKKCA